MKPLPVALVLLSLTAISFTPVSSKPLLFTSARHEAFARIFAKYIETLQHDSNVFARETGLALNFWTWLRGLTCELCKDLIHFVQFWTQKGTTHEEIVNIATTTCIYLGIETERVCTGIVQVFQDEVLTVFDRLVVSPDEVCGILVGDSCGTPYNPLDNWNVTLPDTPKPPVMPRVLPKPGSPTVRVLHLTDIHLDSMYTPGSNAECNEPLCCRANDGKPDPGTSGAGQFGDYRDCDTPLWTLEGLFSHLQAKQDQFDYIMWTGDLPPHNVWNQTRASQTGILKSLSAMVLKYFPNKPVFPSLGNHESSPVNSFPPGFVTGNQSISWLYDTLADTWGKWLPPDTLSTISRGAYYTVSPFPGFRIVSVNMNACNNENWWLLLNTTDPDGQLTWLTKVLQSSEDKKEKVHVVGHIPPGVDDCLKAWSHNYYRIIDRYESTIVGQFFGHTHKDHYEVFYDIATLKRPTSVAYISPSVTPFSNLNMGYRIFTIDGNYSQSSWEVLDHETYILNLTEANMKISTPTWQLEYMAKSTFNMKSLFPEDWNDLITQMKSNDTLLQLFNTYYLKSRVTSACDDKCRKSLLCGLKSGRSHSPELCDDLGFRSIHEYHTLTRLDKLC